MDLFFRRGEDVASVSIEPDGSGVSGPIYRVRVGERWLTVELRRHEGGRLDLLVEGRPVRAYVARAGQERWVKLDGAGASLFEKSESARRRQKGGADGTDELIADTPAQVVSVRVAVGDEVATGDTLLVLEAMKMEFRLTSPHDGTVTAVHCQEGEVVERGRVLLAIER